LVLSVKEEHGIKAHVDFALTVQGDTKSARATNRTNAGLAIAEAFGRADPHICDYDEEDAQHPLHRFGVECLNGGQAALVT
jgi:hypothetical protein